MVCVCPVPLPLLDLMPLLTWGFLGLRLRVCCDTSLVSQLVWWVFAYLDVLALFAHFEVILFDGTMVLWAIMTARGSRVACGAQATPRVDVDVTLGQGGHDVPPPLLLQVPGTHDHPVKTSGRFLVFVKGLAGHTLVTAGCSGDMLVDDFVELVAMRARVPAACFYLVGAGSKALRLGTTLSDAGVVGHSLLFMAGRLRGGSSRPRPPRTGYCASAAIPL